MATQIINEGAPRADDAHHTDGAVKDKTLIREFSFHRAEINDANLPGHRVMQFVGVVRDVAAGMATIANILHNDDLYAEDPDRPDLLTPGDRERLIRTILRNMDSLLDDSHRFTEWAYDMHTPEGREALNALVGGTRHA